MPEPEAGEVRVRVQACALNLNDLERITGGNMMVEPELPYAPGMEVMGVVDLCGDGAEQWLGRRVVATTKGAHGGYADFAALRGDPSDGLPGVPGVGDKTAAKLLGEHASLEGIYASINDVKPDKLREKLR